MLVALNKIQTFAKKWTPLIYTLHLHQIYLHWIAGWRVTSTGAASCLHTIRAAREAARLSFPRHCFGRSITPQHLPTNPDTLPAPITHNPVLSSAQSWRLSPR